MTQTIDEIGHEYGHLKVILQAAQDDIPPGARGAHWACLCGCGEIAIVAGTDLRSGRRTSCGCLKGIPADKVEMGKKHGMLFVLGRAPSRGHGAEWLCQCDCGKRVTARGTDLRTGKTKSCGCLRYKPGKQHYQENYA
jgi:hypothetical protein